MCSKILVLFKTIKVKSFVLKNGTFPLDANNMEKAANKNYGTEPLRLRMPNKQLYGNYIVCCYTICARNTFIAALVWKC